LERVELQEFGEAFDRFQGEVPFAALEAADVGAM
jgi:hypothetical protein